MSQLEQFFRGVPLLARLTPEQLAALADRSIERDYRAGELVLRTGERNASLYLLEEGRLAVQVHDGDSTRTVAHLHPGAPFGELSLMTGRACSADVRVTSDARVAIIPPSALGALPDQRRTILEMLAVTVAERLHSTVNTSTDAEETRVVLLHHSPRWRAVSAFAAALAASLARQAEWAVLRVEFGERSQPPEPAGHGVSIARVDVSRGADALLGELRLLLPAWRRRYACIVLNPPVAPGAVVAALQPLTDWSGYLLGPSDAPPVQPAARAFVVQDARGPTLPRQSGRAQLIADVEQAEQAHAAGQPIGEPFRRTVDSIARCIAQLQVGLALGGGGAWAWSHIGVVRALDRAGVPIDVVSGCSMGSVVGAWLATGRDSESLERAAAEWHRHFPRVIEYRFWRMHLARVSALTRVLRQYFGDRRVNQTDKPFWANALDVEAAEEVALSDGDLVTALLASMALPAWLPPMSRDSRLLIDAVLVDPVPAILTRRMQCHFNIAVNAIGPFKARALQTRFPFRAYDFVSRCLRIVGHQMGQARLEASADAILVPELPADTNMLSFDRYREIIDAGEREAEARLPSILAAYRGRRRATVPADAPVATS